MQFVSSKAVMDFLNRFSLKPVLVSTGSSFILATATSGLIVSSLLPSQKLSTKNRSKQASVNLAVSPKSIDDEQIQQILDRNLFNHEGTLGDAVDSKDSEIDQIATDQLVASSLPLIVQGIIFSGNPLTGLAMIKNKNKSSIKSYTVGDEVMNGAKVAKIYESRVILERNGGFEYIDIERFELKDVVVDLKEKEQVDQNLLV